MSPSGLHHRIAAVVHKIALECEVDSTFGGDRTRCGTDASGQGVFSDVFLADLYPDQRGVGVHLDVTCGNVVGGDGKSKGDHKDPTTPSTHALRGRRGSTHRSATSES